MTDPLGPLRIEDGDRYYAALVEALEAAGPDGAVALLGRLVLILSNQVGEQDVLMAALEAAKTKDA
jgi:hypothetical protein